jgi:hypothetical protein
VAEKYVKILLGKFRKFSTILFFKNLVKKSNLRAWPKKYVKVFWGNVENVVENFFCGRSQKICTNTFWEI